MDLGLFKFGMLLIKAKCSFDLFNNRYLLWDFGTFMVSNIYVIIVLFGSPE